MPYKHILLATDFTEASVKTAQIALDLATRYGAKLSIIHVVEALPAYASGYLGIADIEEELMENAKQQIASLGKQFNISEQNQIVIIGSPKNDVVRIAEENDVDLIVVGSHDKHGIAKLLGSTAAGILHRAHCNVLTVKEV